MGLLFYDKDGHCDIKVVKGVCFACGSKQPTAFWCSDDYQAGSCICVCDTCALEVLPTLMVEAIVAANQGRNDCKAGAILQDFINPIVVRLYRAACAISSTVQIAAANKRVPANPKGAGNAKA